MRKQTLVAAILSLLVPIIAAADSTIQLDIPKQPLADSLRALGAQANINVIYDPPIVERYTAPAIQGQVTKEQALAQLLKGTGLEYTFVTDKTVSIRVASASSGLQGKEARDQTLLAQLSPTSPDDQGQANASDEARNASNTANTRLDEIVVTAQKREQRIQDVPISITAITADEIDRRGLVNADDYLRGVPGVNQVDNGYGGQSIIIRGIETSTSFQNFGSGTTVATYFGETPTTNSEGLTGSTGIDIKLMDIERVEVLRGPQGTALGNSSMGGAVRTIPVAPKLDRYQAKVAAGYSNTSGSGGDNYSIQAVGNLPLIEDKLAIRATAYQFEESGFYDNVAGSDAAFQAAVVGPYGAQPFAVDERQAGSHYVLGGRMAALFQASDDLRITLSYLSQKTSTEGFGVASTGTYDQAILQVAPEHVRNGHENGITEASLDIANALIEYDFGWADLVASYSYLKSDRVISSPWGAFGVDLPISYDSDAYHREDVGEIRLATNFDGAWNFLAGVYIEELQDAYDQDHLWHGDPATNFLNPGQRFLGVYPDRRNLAQEAAFAEVSWEFVKNLTLTGGVRVYDYERSYRLDAFGPFYGGPAGTHVDEASEASGENFRANLSYKLNDNALLYAGWAQGFRLGIPQPGLPSSFCDLDNDGFVDGTGVTIASTRELNSDEVDSYEIGGKFSLLNHRLTIAAAAYRMEWTGLPFRVVLPCANLSRPYLANAGEALSEGIELQASVQIIEPFRVDFGGSWVDARLTTDVPAQAIPSGRRLPGSPQYNANLSFQYDFEVGGYRAFVRADSIYLGPFYDALYAVVPAGFQSGDYVKVDTKMRLDIGAFDIDLYVRNLTNQDAFTFRSRGTAGSGQFRGYRLRPRTIGVQLHYEF